MAIFNSYVKLPEGSPRGPETVQFRLCTWQQRTRPQGASEHRHAMPLGLPLFGGNRKNVPRGQGRFNNNKTEQVKKALQYIFAKHLMCSWGMIPWSGKGWIWLDSLQGTSLATNGQIIFGSCHNLILPFVSF